MSLSLAQCFAVNLKGLRRKAGHSQEALARRARLSVSYVSMLERGQRTPPLECVERLASALCVNALFLLQELDWESREGRLAPAARRPAATSRRVAPQHQARRRANP